MNLLICITGPPKSGKTSLARELAPFGSRIHTDHILMSLAIRRPDLLPPQIANNPNENLLTITNQLHIFYDYLKSNNLENIVFEEYQNIWNARKIKPLVIEGFLLEDWREKFDKETNLLWVRMSRRDDGLMGFFENSTHTFRESHLILRRRLRPINYS